MNLPPPSASPTKDAVLSHLRAQHDATGVIPSQREVQTHFKLNSQNQVVRLLGQLERDGAIRRMPGKARGIVLSPPGSRETTRNSIPVLGAIPAGSPVDTSEHVLGYLPVAPTAFGDPPGVMIFGLQVRGDSMVNAGIYDGDHALCQSAEVQPPQPNAIVAALIDGETSLKRFLVVEDRAFLKAENPNYPDLIPVRELLVQGVFVGLLRGMRATVAS